MRSVLCWLLVSMAAQLRGQANSWVEPYDTLGHQTRTEKAVSAIQAIKNGVLVVRLNSNQRKMDAIRGQLAQPNLKEKYRRQLEQQLVTTRSETLEENRSLVRAFRRFYHFSAVYFMCDTASFLLKNGHTQGFFLNDSLQTDQHISLGDQPWRLVRFGSKSGLRARKSLIGMDRQLRDLPDPFPISGNVPFWQGVLLVFSKKNQWEDNCHFHVGRFDTQLNQFYEKCRRKGWID